MTHPVGTVDWALVGTMPFSGTTSWFVTDEAFSDNDERLTMTDPVDIPASAQLQFFHKYELLTCSAGVVEVSTDGLTWSDLGPFMTQGAYTGGTAGFFCDNVFPSTRPAFDGSAPDYFETRVDLSSFAGASVRIRFRMGSDILGNDPNTGWWIDDIKIVTGPQTIENTAQVVSNEALPREASTSTPIVAPSVPPIPAFGSAWTWWIVVTLAPVGLWLLRQRRARTT